MNDPSTPSDNELPILSGYISLGRKRMGRPQKALHPTAHDTDERKRLIRASGIQLMHA